MARGKYLGDRSRRHDTYYRKARQEGYAARAVYKLSEIDAKHQLFRPGYRVLDLGCRPGSWLQYAHKQVGPQGALVGIDRGPLEVTVPGARLLVGDVFDVSPGELLGDLEAFDVVLSDMAPDTTGVRQVDQARSEALFERALELACTLLAPGGSFVGKLFQGPDFQRLRDGCRARFAKVSMMKPQGSRKQSVEQYVVSKGHTPADPGDSLDDD